MTDPIADMLTRIRNAYMAGKKTIMVPFSGVKFNIATILSEAGYLDGVKKVKDGNHFVVEIALRYIKNEPAITNISRISKPGRRLYVKASQLPRPLAGYGMAVVSTSQGIMSTKTAKEKKLGGELICKIW